jgi:cyclic-di-GMP phosphodiesterase TipF (flagellum assembly factor)
MRRLTLPLLTASYVILAMILALLLWRNGGGWGAGLAAMVGALGLCFAFHGLISRALETTALRGEIEALREAHRIVIDQVERMDRRVSEVVEITTVDAQRRSEELTSEVHLLEDLVQRMSLKL